MVSSKCILIRKSVLPWIAFLTFSVFSTFYGYGVVLSLTITALALVFSIIFLTLSKENPVILEEEETKQEKVSSQSSNAQKQDSPAIEKLVLQEKALSSTEKQSFSQVVVEEAATQEKDVKIDANIDHTVAQFQGFLVRSPADLYSESESMDHYSSSSTEDSDVDWPYSGNLPQSPECSDGSISDEESLIEIALPSGHYVGGTKQDPKSLICHHHKFQDFYSEKLFLAEIINEMNEEENLIEIDLSMGCIKCSRFEIEA